MKTIDELVDLVIKWSSDRKIIQNGKIETQCLKLISEVGELADNIAKKKDIRDDIGDILVLLINISVMYNPSISFLDKITNILNVDFKMTDALGDKNSLHNLIYKLMDRISEFFSRIDDLIIEKDRRYADDWFSRYHTQWIIEYLYYIAKKHNTTLQECLSIAYNDIKDRKGITLPNGCFVKEK